MIHVDFDLSVTRVVVVVERMIILSGGIGIGVGSIIAEQGSNVERLFDMTAAAAVVGTANIAVIIVTIASVRHKPQPVLIHASSIIEHAQVFGLFEKVPTDIAADPRETRLDGVDGNPVKAKLGHFRNVA